jgi:D-alanyl-lipoteichoic acid acyltransferase DltB (MBOAT superfamily)
MLFNSIAFLFFLPITFCLFWGLKKHVKLQNVLILVASYFFYAWWDYRFLGLIFLSTCIDYLVGLNLEKEKKKIRRKIWLLISLVFNLGLLGFFKYYNFFLESWINAWSAIGVEMNSSTLKIILPVGISFYTFQTLSYTIDIYRQKLIPTHNFLNFAAFVSFFPQLVAGPIERASNLLPQIKAKKKFNSDRAISGLNLIIWGLFKKVVVADSCAQYVNVIFENYENLNALTLLLGTFYFAFQIYGDFSGYSDIAIGTARMFGIELMKNFDYPYFSRDIAEFWRRWHISLSTWFRDYLYIPLGGSRVSKIKQLRNVIIIFSVSGFWHGPNWTFIAWGLLHALFFIPLLVSGKNRKNLDQVSFSKLLPSIREFCSMFFTFALTSLAWIFFRAESIGDAITYLKNLLTKSIFSIEYLSIERYSIEILPIIGVLLLIEWFNRNQETPFSGKFKWFKLIVVILMVLLFGVYSDHQEFIYFQF